MLIKIISRVIYLIAKSLSLTCRYRFVGIEHIDEWKKNSQASPFLFAIWHQYVLTGIFAQNGKQFVVMASKSKDSEPVAYTCRKLGHLVVRGSSRKADVDKGGQKAKQDMLHILQSGVPGALTVDGPRGPARQVKHGIIDLALELNIPIIPYFSIPQKYWQFNSWDQFKLVRPFSKVVVAYGAPILLTPEQRSHAAELIKQSLDALEIKSEAAFDQWEQLSKENFQGYDQKLTR